MFQSRTNFKNPDNYFIIIDATGGKKKPGEIYRKYNCNYFSLYYSQEIYFFKERLKKKLKLKLKVSSDVYTIVIRLLVLSRVIHAQRINIVGNRNNTMQKNPIEWVKTGLAPINSFPEIISSIIK